MTKRAVDERTRLSPEERDELLRTLRARLDRNMHRHEGLEWDTRVQARLVYTLHVLAAALFDKQSFNNAVCHGVLLGSDGRKMSKRLKNYPDPMDVVAEHGSDALRIALLSSPLVRGIDIRFNEDAVRDAARRYIIAGRLASASQSDPRDRRRAARGRAAARNT